MILHSRAEWLIQYRVSCIYSLALNQRHYSNLQDDYGMHAKKGLRKVDWFKPVNPELKNALPFGIRKTPTKIGEGTGVSTKKERTRRPSHDGTVYFDPKNNRWIGQLPAVRKWDGTIKRPSVSGGTQAEVLEKLRQFKASYPGEK